MISYSFRSGSSIILLIYVISPVDALPGPVDDTLLCLLYAFMNYKGMTRAIPGNDEIEDKKTV